MTYQDKLMNPGEYFANRQEQPTNPDYAFLEDTDFVPIDSAPLSPFSQNQLLESNEADNVSFNFADLSSRHFTPTPPDEECARLQSLNAEIQLYLNSKPEAFKQCEYFESIG